MTLPFQDQLEGKYEILHKIKEGGMGAIYKVRHRLLEEVRVIKIIRPQFAEDESLQHRFTQEARTAIRLRHPNVAQLYDFAVAEDGTAYMVMEYIDGITLQQVLAHHGPPSLGLTLEISRQTLVALGYLHHQGYVHRDISSDNLMLARNFDGTPLIKLIDLGIAKRLGGGGQLTRTGTFLGKLRYSSPEQFAAAEGSAQVDARSDLYAFTLVLYELLTGRFPIPGEDFSQLIAGHLFRDPLAFEDSDPEGRVPPALRRLVLQGLEKEPARRLATAEELLERLEAFQDPHVSHTTEVAEVLASAATPAAEARPEPGSTQRDLDRRFDPAATPSPSRAGLPSEAPAAAPVTGSARLPERTLAFEGDSPEPPPSEEPETGATSAAGSGPKTLEHERTAVLDAEDISAAREQAAREQTAAGDSPPGVSESGERRVRVEQLLSRARTLSADGRLTEVVETLESTLAVDPGHSQARELLDQTRKALLERAEREERKRAEDLARAGRDVGGLLERGELDAAELRLQLAQEECGADPTLHILQQRLDGLRRRADADALLARAREHTAAGALAEARQALDRAVERVADHPQAEALRAEIDAAAQRQTEREEAERHLAEAEQAVAASLRAGRFDQAAQQLDFAIETLGPQPLFTDLAQKLEAARRRRLESRLAKLLSGAQKQMGSGDPESASELLRELLELDPDHSVARALLGEAESENVRRESERKRAEALAASVAEIGSLLDRGALDGAEKKLETARVHWGEHEELLPLGQRLDQLREAKARAERRRRLEAAVRAIASAIVDGELARAEQELTAAIAEHGDLEELRQLRRRLEPAQRAARESPARPSGLTAVPQPSATPPPFPAAVPEPEEETRDTRRPPSAPRRWRPAAAAVLLAAVAAGAGWWLSHPSEGPGTDEPPAEAASETESPRPAGASGTLVLDVLPWAEIASIRDSRGEPRDLGPQTHTPLVLHLPPGTYTFELRHPSLGSPTEITVEVPPSGTVERLVDLGKVNADAYFAKVGW